LKLEAEISKRMGKVSETLFLNFMSVRSFTSFLFVRAARALLCPSSLELGCVGIYGSENRRIFSDLRKIPTALEHGFYVRARRTSA
jgi:hypothetical protein